MPFAYTVKEACEISRAGRTTLYAAIRRGELVARKRGTKTLILEQDLRQWIEQLPALKSAPGEI
ncbi:MAG: helix-turn-helix domain-containing protein [Pseudolabrys sp.]|nr:helix-turn-helix domain-containing protein [Pseudolabrys sp.]MDP2298310.1 helix-turn-helix domain-containing protein [Pseudolabrys sp.]